jgi:hypothetical protein
MMRSVPDEPLIPRWLTIILELLLVLVCAAVAGVAALATLSCLDENVPAPGVVCTSPTAQRWYEVSIVAALAIAVLGVGVAHAVHRWRVAWLSAATSVALTIIAVLWGFH